MKTVFLFLVLYSLSFLVVSCSTNGTAGNCTTNPSFTGTSNTTVSCTPVQASVSPSPTPVNTGCTVVQTNTGATLSCTESDGTVTTTSLTNGQNGINGANGSSGATGQPGTPAINPGLQCSVYSILASDYSSTVSWAKLLSDGTLKFSTVFSNFNVSNEVDTTLFTGFTAAQQALVGISNWALDCNGFINIPESGNYQFNLGSDDGSELAINNTVLINMPQPQSYNSQTSSVVYLYKGEQYFNLLYYQGPVTNLGLTLKWQGPSNAGLGIMQVVPASAFTYQVQ